MSSLAGVAGHLCHLFAYKLCELALLQKLIFSLVIVKQVQ